MDRNGNRNNGSQSNGNQNNENGNTASWIYGALGLTAAAAATAAGAYLLATRQNSATPRTEAQSSSRRRQDTTDQGSSFSLASISSLLSRMTTNYSDKVIKPADVPNNPVINNLNSLLADIYVRFVQLKCDDFQRHYKVFTNIFSTLHQTMKDVEPYFNKYSSDIKYAGSHYDRLRIKRPDEFDMDIVISLPLNYRLDPLNPFDSDFVLEPKGPGFVQLKMGQQFMRLPFRDGAEWQINRPAFEWKDDQQYLLRSNFINWFKSVAYKALNRHASNGVPTFYVEGERFTVRNSESGPAFTIFIENGSGFRLDVDLVPALKFPENRWPISSKYRSIPSNCQRGNWLLVPKPDKSAGSVDQSRVWRIALQDQERELMKNLNNCKQIIRLLKKLRDAQGMKKIASYYVKTLFLWEIVDRNDPVFWRKSQGELFMIMVQRFHQAMVNGTIPYFWNKSNNLIGGVNPAILNEYAGKLQSLLNVLQNPSEYKRVAKYLLTNEEFNSYSTRFLHL